MSKIFYRYDGATGLLITSFEGVVDKLASKDGKIVYAVPPGCTDIAPYNHVAAGKVQFFDPKMNCWRITVDNRGTKVINKNTKEIRVWDKIGVISEEYTTIIPTQDRIPYVTWQGTYWGVTSEKRTELLDRIWSLRKSNRDRACVSDLEYNGHWYHVDPTSFNDITLAAQEAVLSGDMETTRRWITADDINVQLSGADLVQIMKAYGDRRQQLVYASNEAWQDDLNKTTDELFDILAQLQEVNHGE